MNKCLILFLTASLLVITSARAANPKTEDIPFLSRKVIVAKRIQTAPHIDGIPDEACWKGLPVATNFVQYSPVNGARPQFETAIRFGYNDDALYISAIMYDPHPDSICMEMGKRDQVEILNTDYISFDILPYNDAQNMYEFKVTPAGLQNDAKYSAVGQDENWDAVWESAARITDSAWMVEVRIPYSALRFPKAEIQVWGINMWRNLRRKNEWSTWCFVDNKVQDIFNYYGEITGMENISPPLRLSFTPYVAGYIQSDPEGRQTGLMRGGMDLRWGLNESHTVDMMLIPDFGQVESDDRILNLTPFEIKYEEKRQFFTEGTEMFEKCDIFYSRRVGAMPRNFFSALDSLNKNEHLKSNPEETRIINATKISGRNSNGLGLGFFNAMTNHTWATAINDSNNQARKILTQPFTNYNVSVLDQNLKNNSYLTFINTNYFSPKDHYMANVTGTETRITNKSGTFAIFGQLNISNKVQNATSTQTGHSAKVSIMKPSGKFQYALEHEQADRIYDPNDIGFLNHNNFASNAVSFWYSQLQPKGRIINMISRFTGIYNTLYEALKRKNLSLEIANKTTYRNFWMTHISFIANPLGLRDYYEPRIWGRYFDNPAYYSTQWTIATDSRKPFYLKTVFTGMLMPERNSSMTGITLSPRMRFNDRLTMTLTIGISESRNDYGWVTTNHDSLRSPLIIFGKRNVTTLSSVFSGRYVFSARTSLTLRIRHYWSGVEYTGFYLLDNAGGLGHTEYAGNHNINFNAFSGDAQFVWYFAPGSEMSIVWKSTADKTQNILVSNYFENLGETFSGIPTNSLSIRILYYLDYQLLKKLVSPAD